MLRCREDVVDTEVSQWKGAVSFWSGRRDGFLGVRRDSAFWGEIKSNLSRGRLPLGGLLE